MDKAPDAFRTISEVAHDLDVPQHVLRFWETRFAQIKPMKRSGGRRYYRPDDVDLLKGIRRLLYGEGYTIRGVQRILKEHGVKSVQSLAEPSAAVSFGAIEEVIVHAHVDDPPRAATADADQHDGSRTWEFDAGFTETAPDVDSVTRGSLSRGADGLDRERLEGVLRDLIDCRHRLEEALKEG